MNHGGKRNCVVESVVESRKHENGAGQNAAKRVSQTSLHHKNRESPPLGRHWDSLSEFFGPGHDGGCTGTAGTRACTWLHTHRSRDLRVATVTQPLSLHPTLLFCVIRQRALDVIIALQEY